MPEIYESFSNITLNRKPELKISGGFPAIAQSLPLD